MKDENYQTITMLWNEIAITIRHNPNWISSYKETYGEYMTHTEIRSDDGKQLPMTETGYRSHFTVKSEIDKYGDVRAYVKAWLDEEGKSKKWKAYVADQSQLKLFQSGEKNMNTHDIYKDVTNTIIELLETQKEDWNKPWIDLGVDNDHARNPSTEKYYRGINQFLLSIKMMQKGYLKNQWATFQQIKKMKGNVIKGEKSTPIIFYKTSYIDQNKKYYSPETIKKMDSNTNSILGIKAIPIIKTYQVFNIASQTENLDDGFYMYDAIEELKDFEKDESAENLIRQTGARIIERNSNRAFYNATNDEIILPNRNQFKGNCEPFYATALHELGHWTGHKSRLNREFGKAFGDSDYAKEELVAELCSAFCSAHLGFTKTITNNVAYLENWLSILKADHKAIISAASKAQKATDYILGGAESHLKIDIF